MLLDAGLLEMPEPDFPNSPTQQYPTALKGSAILALPAVVRPRGAETAELGLTHTTDETSGATAASPAAQA
jgi:hypothetical protein